MKMKLEYWPGMGRRMMGLWVPLLVLKGPSLTSEARIVIVEDLLISLVDRRIIQAYP
jgi:hypothetical protein